MTSELDDSHACALTESAETEREVLGWLEFGEASRHLAGEVLESGFEPDLVVAIARGGLMLAGAVSYALGVKACGLLNVEFYTGFDERLPEPVLLPPVFDAAALDAKRVLLVDDVADSGRTLAMVIDLIAASGAEIRTACLYAKSQTVIVPDFLWRRTDRWIVFPWSALPPVTATY
ncbi:phosphoribosyltransferase [Leifsonia xyli subsp. xyli]|uniref:Xanthine-guanine phosphoribosyltransferase n=2 Tax=Leifsonia xyli subsp. xyli TaxID=59736 RepID=Q6ADC4_LEIXX|nr:phosphoribosyltransferase [Leifsonia xyli]AAT89620.1 xanthine-guanine phosphoribosyltransferase [Leifsonia xyli subsp. xyli str. CTCB07]ODA91273.1 phosphoribosyltransferase [Leifsonia xyli subsp. xyli]